MNRVLSFLGGALFLLLFLCSSSFGQSDSMPSPNLEGKWGLSFHINSDLTLHALDGKLLSIKKMTDNNHAWRLGLSLSVKSGSYDSMLSISTSIVKQRYFDIDKLFRPYYGIGLLLGYNHTWQDYYQEIDLTFGPIAHIGVECLVNKRISLTGEYGASFLILYNIFKDSGSLFRYQNHFYVTDRSFTFIEKTARLGLTVYFGQRE